MADYKEDDKVSIPALIVVMSIIAMIICLAFWWVTAFWIAFIVLLIAAAVGVLRSPDTVMTRLPWQ